MFHPHNVFWNDIVVCECAIRSSLRDHSHLRLYLMEHLTKILFSLSHLNLERVVIQKQVHVSGLLGRLMRRLFIVVEQAQQEDRSQADPEFLRKGPIASQGVHVFLFTINFMHQFIMTNRLRFKKQAKEMHIWGEPRARQRPSSSSSQFTSPKAKS